MVLQVLRLLVCHTGSPSSRLRIQILAHGAGKGRNRMNTHRNFGSDFERLCQVRRDRAVLRKPGFGSSMSWILAEPSRERASEFLDSLEGGCAWWHSYNGKSDHRF